MCAPDPVAARIRSVLSLRHGPNHPQLDSWVTQALDLHQRRQDPAIRRATAAFPPLSAAQRERLAFLLSPTEPGPADAFTELLGPRAVAS